MRDLGSRDSRFDSCHLDLSANDEINVAVPVRQKQLKTQIWKMRVLGTQRCYKAGKASSMGYRQAERQRPLTPSFVSSNLTTPVQSRVSTIAQNY